MGIIVAIKEYELNLSSKIMRKIFLSIFFSIPILSSVCFISAAFFFGNTGFKIDKTQNGLLISKITASVNSVELNDMIISIHGLSHSEFLGYAFIKPLAPRSGSMTILRDSAKKDLFIETIPFTIFPILIRIWPQLMLIIVFLTLGSIALFRAPPCPQVTLFFLMLCSLSTSLSMTMPSSLALLSPVVFSSAFLIHAVFNWISFGLWLHFALRFPETRDMIQHRWWIPLCIYLLPAITTIGGSLYMSGFTPEFWSWVQRLRNLYLPFIIIAVFAKHVVDYKKAGTQQEKNQIKFPLIAYWLTFTPYLFFYLLPNLLIDHPLISFKIAMFGFFILPMAYLLSILRYRLFNVDQIISRTMAYFISIIALSIIYSLFLISLKQRFVDSQILSIEVFLIFLILMNIIFHPVILKLDLLIRKIFFKDEPVSVKTMHEFSNKISSTLRFSELIRIIIDELPKAIKIKSIAIMTFKETRSTLFPEHLQFATTLCSESRLVKLFKDKSLAYLSPYQAIEDAELKIELMEIQKAGFSLLLPLNGSKSLSALLFVGHKKGGELFSEQDIHLLASFANQAAIAFENAIYHDSMMESKEQLEEMFDQKVQSEKMAAIGEMTSILAHELKNPLGIIHSSAQYLIDGKQSKNVTQEMLHYIKNEVENLNLSINSILKFARQRIPEFEKVDLLIQVDYLISQWQHSDDHRGDVEININVAGALPCIYADFKQIGQVLLNLVRNSEEMMDNGGLIMIELKQDYDFIQIQVIDNGPGIPDKNLDKVFQNFFTTKKQGIGLGLAVCEQIINAHNGEISLKNNNISDGAIACIRLPIKPLTTIVEPNLLEAMNEA
ncbi:MAG: hypothetical protein KAJ62_04555 [Desulfobacteraceae bacterium]|nr:hypothetical protein [Desulfobacteraceae bacterium]